MGKAIDYAYKLRPRLRRYTDDGRYHIDNNPVECAQRPSVMGRKNYFFSKSDSGAVDNAISYSLIESCDVVGVEPLQWLTDVLNKLHDDTIPEKIRLLLPYYYKESCKKTRDSFHYCKTACFGWLLINHYIGKGGNCSEGWRRFRLFIPFGFACP